MQHLEISTTARWAEVAACHVHGKVQLLQGVGDVDKRLQQRFAGVRTPNPYAAQRAAPHEGHERIVAVFRFLGKIQFQDPQLLAIARERLKHVEGETRADRDSARLDVALPGHADELHLGSLRPPRDGGVAARAVPLRDVSTQRPGLQQITARLYQLDDLQQRPRPLPGAAGPPGSAPRPLRRGTPLPCFGRLRDTAACTTRPLLP